VDVNVEGWGRGQNGWMQMLLKGEDDDMGMMAKVGCDVEGWGKMAKQMQFVVEG